MKKRNAIMFLAGIVTGIYINYKLIGNKIYEQKQQMEKYERLFFLLKRMLGQKRKRDDLCSYLEENGFKKVAVYGMEHLGQILADELKDMDLELLYGIDPDKVSSEIDIYRLADEMPEPDVVIVTSLFDFQDRKRELEKRFSCPIISLEELV